MSYSRKIKLGFILHGVGRTWDDWRHPDRDVHASTSYPFYLRQTRLAEEGKFDFVFVADSLSINEKSSPHYLNRFEPITILSALAGATRRIGIVGTVTVSYSEPFNVARQFASLDQISNGRAGWNVVTSWLGETAANFSRDKHPEHAERYRIAAEYLDVVQGLWDSWEDDALVGDKQSGLFVDPAKLHSLNHRGQYFQVRGPLNIRRSPQGQPVIFQAGASDTGRGFAARSAEVIFTIPQDFEEAQEFYRDVKLRARNAGRGETLPYVLPGINPVIGLTPQDAEARYQELISLGSLKTGLGMISRMFNDHDFSQYNLDGPFPDVEVLGRNSSLSNSQRILKTVRVGNLTLRQIAEQIATPRSEFVGAPDEIADRLQHWFENEAADGFIYFETLPGQLDIFIRHVVPRLQERGLFRNDYEHETLRENLGLSIPVNRYTAQRSARSSA